jgi:AsmA protein
MMNIVFTAGLSCKEMRKDNFIVHDLDLIARYRNRVLELQPITMAVFGARSSGSVHADFSNANSQYNVIYSLPKFQIEEFIKIISPGKIVQGQMSFSMQLSMQGKSKQALLRSMQGQFSLRGNNLVLSGIDLDQEISQYEDSQHFSLLDAGAFFFSGPFGLLITKGYDFASIAQSSEGSSEVRTLVSDWNVKHGIAFSKDVAMATHKNRIALHGEVDFSNEQFNDMSIALIDAKGCVIEQETLRGTFQDPVVEKPGAFKSFTGPALKLLKKGRDLLPGDKCEVFYNGSVMPPE